MAQTFFAGKSGNVKVDGYQNVLRVKSWNYVSGKTLLDITNSLSYGTDQFISTLNSGNITLNGFITKQWFDDNIIAFLEQGTEVKVDLYFDNANTIGFEDIDAVIDEFDFNLDLEGVGIYKMTLLRNEPKI
jgi:hypothetical protein